MTFNFQRKQRRAFSLIELLVVMAVISCLAAMAVFHFISIRGQAQIAKSRHNARNICSVYQSARSVGATFTATTREGILEELIDGKYGRGAFSTSRFQITLAEEEKAPALAYCLYDAALDAMLYDPTGGDGKKRAERRNTGG